MRSHLAQLATVSQMLAAPKGQPEPQPAMDLDEEDYG
jgi:hypothetical protein